MSDLTDRLRIASTGRKVWRVQDPSDGSYCMSFDYSDSFSPELEARNWLADHQRNYPNSKHAGYAVACVTQKSAADKLMQEAADEIDRLRVTNKMLMDDKAALMSDNTDLQNKVVMPLRERVAGLEQGILEALPSSTYMDPPDGGDVDLVEQLGRMAKDAARYRWLRDKLDLKDKAAWNIFMAEGVDQWDAAIDAARAALKGEAP